MEDWISLVVSALLGGGVGAFLYNVLHNFGLNRRLAALEARYDSLLNTIHGAKGNKSIAESKENLNAAIAEGAAMLSQGMPTQDILKTLAVKYPGVAADMMKRFGMG